jgi:hypothetical protein
MDRRTAIKNIGLGFGVTVSMGTMMSLLQSCGEAESGKAADGWTPAFFTNQDEFELVEKFTGIIIPRTDTPGAKNLNVIRFIDATLAEIYEPVEQEVFRKGMAVCTQRIQQEEGKRYAACSYDQLTDFLQRYIGNKADKAVFEKQYALSEIEPKNAGTVAPEQLDDYHFYSFLLRVRKLTIAGFFGTEYIGEKVMTYQPVPGPFQGCIDYTGFNTYSL